MTSQPSALQFTRLPASALRITGADRLDFVQGQMTNDLRAAATPSVIPAAFLNVKGQMQQFAYIYRRENDIYLHLDAGHAASLAERFARYIIFDQVEVQDLSGELRTLHLWGDWPALAGLPARAEATAGQAWDLPLSEGVRALFGAVNRTGHLGLDLHYLARLEDEVVAALSQWQAHEAPLEQLHLRRIQAGIPDPVADGFLGLLPQEVGLDSAERGGVLSAISYRKGCYVGQEIMARLEARGRQRYGLQRVQLQGEQVRGEQVQGELAAGSSLRSGTKVVGQVGMVRDGYALARLRRDLPEQAELSSEGVAVRVCPSVHAEG